MYHILEIQIREKDAVFSYCDTVTKCANNLYNAALFRVRQVMTGLSKEAKDRTENENGVLQEITDFLPAMGARFKMPTREKWYLGYEFLNALLHRSGNPDYFAGCLPRHTAQHVLKTLNQDMKGYFALCRLWKKDKSSLQGRPKLPKYKLKGGNCTAVLSNQECVVYTRKDGSREIKLPRLKERIQIGNAPVSGRLKEAKIIPTHGIFILKLTIDDGIAEVPQKSGEPERICAINMGVNNIAAITNNIGRENLLFKGGVVKSINQWANKRAAEIAGRQTKGTSSKFVPTKDYHGLWVWRNSRVDDFVRKAAVCIVNWCAENGIDTIVVGKNLFWKQEVNIGRVNNQNFVEIPFAKLQFQIQYRAERRGIRYIEQEESYTSKASFLSRDPIPVYEKGADANFEFGGRRISRGLYRDYKSGAVINADLNGSANILRKAFPDAFAFGTVPDFKNTRVIVHPDDMLEAGKSKPQKAVPHKRSRAADRRASKRLKSSPSGVGLCG